MKTNTLLVCAILLAGFARCHAALNGAAIFTDAALTTPGLTGSYVNQSLSGVTAPDDWRLTQTISGTRVDANLAFTTGGWGTRAPVGITGGSNANWENFSVQWDGWLQVTQAGQRFAPVSDDGSRMWIDLNGNTLFEAAELVENGWGRVQGVTIRDRSRGAPAGAYRIRIQYHEGSGGNEFHLVSSNWVPPQFVPAAGNPRQIVRAIVLNFDPRVPSEGNRRLWEIFGWSDPKMLMRQFEADLEFASGGAIDIQIVEVRTLDEFPLFTDGYRYSPEEYVANRRSNTGWHVGVDADFYHLAKTQGLEALVNSNQIDEIWCFGDHFFALFGEAWMAGPNSFFVNGPSFPDIGFDRAIAGYGFSYERGVAEMIHNLCHRTENHGQRAFGNWNLATPVTAFDKFSANYLDSTGQAFGVGTCHVPTNADGHYDYGNVRVVQSTAFDWKNFPNVTGATTAVGRDTWGMSQVPDYQRDYLNFYFGMLPRNPGTAPDGRQANWFKYIWDFNSYEAGTGLRRQEDAFAAGATITQPGGASHDFTVRYYDVTGINITTLGHTDLQVRAPGGALLPATLVNVGAEMATTGGTARTVTYRVNAPGGTWDGADAGTYTVVMLANQVHDTLGNPVPAGDLGRFLVSLTDASLIGVAAMLSSGQATAAHTTIDTGPITNLFDGNTTSLIRTPNIDPAVVTLTFTQPQTVSGFSAYFSHAGGNPAYRWKIETANTLADLDGQTGSYQLAVPLTNTASDLFSTSNLPTPITAKLVRLWATRLTGDDYVHINEWRLLAPPFTDTAPPVPNGGSSSVNTPGGTAQFITVTYTDATAVDVATLGSGDLLVSGPDGFTASPSFFDVDNHFDGTPRMATYWFIPPGGTWDRNDNGVYTFELQSGAARDTIGNGFAAPQQLGTFSVNIPPSPSDSDGDGLRNAWELTYWPTIVGHDADDDFDSDGFTELEELGFGLNPTVANVAGAPQVVKENGYLTVTITKRPGAAYEVQSAGALLGGLPNAFSASETVVLVDSAATLKVRDDVLIGTPPARFLRVKVLAAP